MKKTEYDFELLFRALADRTRLRVINLVGDEEVCVCFLVEVLKTSQPKVSRHLDYLRRAGLVSSRREGKWMNYRLCNPGDADAARIFRDVRDWLARNSEMNNDRIRLEKLCGASHVSAQLQRAPRPVSLGA